MSVHNTFLKTSDFILFVCLAVAGGLEYVFPTALPVNSVFSMTSGIGIILIAWTIIYTIKVQFKKSNQKSAPGNETVSIIQDGIFKYSRNPIYLGILLISISLGLILNSIWILISSIPAGLLLHYLLILPEEKYLLSKFGDVYKEYMNKVNRWI